MAGWWQEFEADIAAVDAASEREHQAAIGAGHPWPLRPEHALQASPAIAPRSEGRAAQLNELLGQVADAAGRLAADHTDRESRAEYAARIEREVQAEPEPVRQHQASDQAEIEM